MTLVSVSEQPALSGSQQAASKYRVIVADPPWQFSDKLPGKGRGAAKHYDTLTLYRLCQLELPPIADDAHLFLWRVSSMQAEALMVAVAWGFTVKSELVWLKRTRLGKRHFGMGRHVRMEHEVCLICTRGKGAGIANKGQRSTFEAPIGVHSQKPAEFFRIVEGLCTATPRLELFARSARPGWTTIGDQVPGNEQTLEVHA